MLLAYIALVIGAYLLGSLPYMMLLGRAKGVDLSKEEDLHIALWHKVGRLEGLSGVLVDMLKGVIPIIIGFVLDFPLAVTGAAGVAAVGLENVDAAFLEEGSKPPDRALPLARGQRHADLLLEPLEHLDVARHGRLLDEQQVVRLHRVGELDRRPRQYPDSPSYDESRLAVSLRKGDRGKS